MIRRGLCAAVIAAFFAVLSAPASAQQSPYGLLTKVVSSNISSATTTVVVSPVANKTTYVFYAGGESSGTDTSATINFEYSTSSTCASGNTAMLPVGANLTTGAGNFTPVYSSGASPTGFAPADLPYPVPAGDYVCAVTTGSAVAVYALLLIVQI